MFQILVNEKTQNLVNEKIESNKKEWNKINNIWLEIKNNNKINHPELDDTESDASDDNNICENNTPSSKILKRCGSSYDELLSSQDCVITEKNEIKCDTPIMHDGVEDSKTHFTSSSSSLSSSSLASSGSSICASSSSSSSSSRSILRDTVFFSTTNST